MARIISVTFETTTQGRPGAFTVPRAAATVLGLGADDPVELRLTWEGGRLELATDLRSGWEVYHRTSDPSTSGLETIPPKTPITVTVWGRGDADSEEVVEPDRDKGWWGEDQGADFESRIDSNNTDVRRILEWARALADDDLIRLYSYHNADGSIFTLLPYLKQHEAGLVTAWGNGRMTLFRSVFARFAPESMSRIEELLGEPMRPKPSVASADEAMLSALREAYVAAADVPAGIDWTDERFDATFRHAVGSTELLDKLRAWAVDHDVRLRYGAGKASGPLHFDVPMMKGKATLISVGANGGIEWVFRNNLDATPGLADRDARVDLVRRLRSLFGVERPDDRADTWFGVNASTLALSDHAQFLEILEEQLSRVSHGGSDLRIQYQRLFRQVLDRFKDLRPGLTAVASVGTDNWLQFSAGRSGFAFAWSMARSKYFRAELYIDVGDQATNKQYFDRLRERDSELESQIGQPIAWESLNTKRAFRLAVYHDAPTEHFDSDAELIEWAAETMARIVDVLRPAVKTL